MKKAGLKAHLKDNKKRNGNSKTVSLYIGAFILFVIFIIMLYPDMFATKSPYTVAQLKFLKENGKLVVEAAPYPPSKEFLFGSDDLGRDIFSYILYGTRLTIILGCLMAVCQFFIAIPFALLGGAGHKIVRSLILQGNVIFSAIPALLISIMLLQLDFFTSLNKEYSIIAFILVITFVGWPKLGKLLMERVELIYQQPFIKGEIAIGKKNWQIGLQNVMPHLVPEIIVLFFMEIARNLSMMMQLGIFGVFVGNLKIIKDSDMGNIVYYNVSFEPEWASMLSTSRTMLGVAPWTVLFPAMAFLISVLGFNLFGEGIRERLQRKDATIIPHLFKLFHMDAKDRKSVGIAFLKSKGFKYVMVLLVIVMAISGIRSHPYTFDINQQEGLAYSEVVIGSAQAEEVRTNIKNKMINLGINPLKAEDYLIPYATSSSYKIKNQVARMKVNLVSKELIPNVDFVTLSGLEETITGNVYDGTKQDLFNIESYQSFENQWVLINKAYYNEAAIDYIMENIYRLGHAKGFILIDSEPDTFKVSFASKSDIPVVLVRAEIGEVLSKDKTINFTIETSFEREITQGVNVLGIFEGEDEYLKEEVILIGMNYNYLTGEGDEALLFQLELMEELCQLEGNKRSIIFVFYDGVNGTNFHGISSLVDNFPYSSQKVKAYVDLTLLGKGEGDELILSTEQAPITRPFAWSLAHLLEENLEKDRLSYEPLESIRVSNEFFYTQRYSLNTMFWDRGIPTIIIGTREKEIVNGTLMDQKEELNKLGSILLESINKNNY